MIYCVCGGNMCVHMFAKQYLSITKVEVNSFGVADVKDAIRFRREPSPNL